MTISDEAVLIAKLRRTQAWLLFVGSNILVVLFGAYLWIDDPGRLPLLLGIVPVLIVLIFFLLRPGVQWNREYLLPVMHGVAVLYGLYLFFHTSDWIWLLAVASGSVLLFLRISALRKRIG